MTELSRASQVTEAKQRQQRDARGRETAEALLATLRTAVQQLASEARDPHVKEQLKELIRSDVRYFKLEDAATACTVTGRNFTQFVVGVLCR